MLPRSRAHVCARPRSVAVDDRANSAHIPDTPDCPCRSGVRLSVRQASARRLLPAPRHAQRPGQHRAGVRRRRSFSSDIGSRRGPDFAPVGVESRWALAVSVVMSPERPWYPRNPGATKFSDAPRQCPIYALSSWQWSHHIIFEARWKISADFCKSRTLSHPRCSPSRTPDICVVPDRHPAP